jgi:hypothetical protein
MTAKDDAENKEIADLVATRAATRGEESVELDEAAAQVLDDAELLEFVREDGESIHDLVVRIGRYQSGRAVCRRRNQAGRFGEPASAVSASCSRMRSNRSQARR